MCAGYALPCAPVQARLIPTTRLGHIGRLGLLLTSITTLPPSKKLIKRPASALSTMPSNDAQSFSAILTRSMSLCRCFGLLVCCVLCIRAWRASDRGTTEELRYHAWQRGAFRPLPFCCRVLALLAVEAPPDGAPQKAYGSGMYIYIYIYIYTCVSIYIYIYMCIYLYIEREIDL